MKTRLATLLPLLALAACAENNASVSIEAVCAPPDDCTFAGECDAQTLAPIAIDVAVAQELLIFVQVNNRLVANNDVARFRANTNDAFVQEYEIEYPGTGLPTARGSIQGSAHVPAAGSTVVALPVVDSATRGLLSSALADASIMSGVAEVKLKGAYGDTTGFTTGIFRVNVTACKNAGCADLCPATSTVSVACPPDAFGQSPVAGTVCAP